MDEADYSQLIRGIEEINKNFTLLIEEVKLFRESLIQKDKRPIVINCDHCHGTGKYKYPGDDFIAGCMNCHGRGQVTQYI